MAQSKPQPGFSLGDTNPELARQIRNTDPFSIKPFSNDSALWVCDLGHSWESRISERSQGYGCPYCSNQKVLAGYNDLATTIPELAAQAHGWDPTTVTRGTKKLLDWKCPVGHIFTSSPKDRNRANQNLGPCPVCIGRQVLIGFNDLVTTHPEIAAQANGWDAQTVTKNSTKRTSWKCSFGHTWITGTNIRVKGIGCAVCSNQLTLPGENDLGTTHPELAAQAYGWDPTTLVAGSNKKVNWQCELGHIWVAQVSARLRGNGCPSCANKIVVAGFNDLATSHPDIASQANGWDPTTITFGSDKKKMWLCERGHEYSSTVASRCSGQGCPYCSGQKCLPGFNDLATTHPHLAAQAVGWDPTAYSAGAHNKLSWRCDSNHEFQAQIANRTIGTNCPICANKTVLAGFNDLATTHPLIANEANGWDPTTLVFGSNKKVGWKCAEGHEWHAVVTSRASGGRACPYCSGNKVIKGFNDFATINPNLLHEIDGWDPSEIAAFSDRKLAFICEHGHRWKTSAKNRSIGRACPSCAKTGYDPNKNGWLYFLRHDGFEMFQIGITNDPKRRLAKHRAGGWAAIDLRGPMDGHLTRDLESSILISIKRRGAVLANSQDVTRFDGWREAWTCDSLMAISITKLLEFVYEDEDPDNN
jgi:hypothetical protein